VGALVAEALANRGHRVHFVTPYEMIMPYAGISHRMETPDILRRKLASIHTEAIVGGVDGRMVWIVRPDGTSVVDIEAGTVVAITASEPRLELVDALDRLAVPYSVIGSAVAPRVATDAFRDGAEAALAL
jgi:NADPH-dependent 2,4-dienoyl-CoA reductase/sulfur reductase-like enzyme